jgi:hypothetical protein
MEKVKTENPTQNVRTNVPYSLLIGLVLGLLTGAYEYQFISSGKIDTFYFQDLLKATFLFVGLCLIVYLGYIMILRFKGVFFTKTAIVSGFVKLLAVTIIPITILPTLLISFFFLIVWAWAH